MTGRELVTAAIRGEDVVRIPWVPFVGCHGGFLIGVTASEYLKSADLMVQGMAEAVKRYRPDGIPVAFDLQIEAEALGCNLAWSDQTPPAVISHPLVTLTTLEQLKVPSRTDGRIPVVLEAAGRMRKEYPDLALYGLITGPFTLALHLLGTDIFMEMFEDPQGLQSLMGFCTKVGEAMASYYIDAGCDIIAVVDPMTSQIGPDQFTQFVAPFALSIFSSIRRREALSSFFVCGQAQQNIIAMCATGPDNISIDENIPLDYVREECLRRGISFGGNLQLTVVLLLGSEIEAKRHAIETMDTGGSRGFILAPGCDLPYDTPAANIEAVAAVVHDPYQRDVARTMKHGAASQDVLDMSEYGRSGRVIVDIITLDSEACAPCQYMVEAVTRVAPEFEGVVEWREHKIKYRESIRFMSSLMVKNIPTICIDGKITFVSRIPPKEELIAAIQRRIIEKLRFRIRRKRTEVHVLGGSEQECAQVREHVDKAVSELGADIDVRICTDKTAVASYGVSRTPAVVIVNYAVKSEGIVPQPLVIREWIKDLS
jgi:MtaA/CmuA family methyltransferase